MEQSTLFISLDNGHVKGEDQRHLQSANIALPD